MKSFFSKALHNVIYPLCAVFTAIMLVISLGMLTLKSGRPAFLASDILTIAAISLVFSLLGLIFRIKSLNLYVRIALHFIFTELALYLTLFIASQASSISANVAGLRIFAVVAYAIVYIIIATIVILRGILKSSDNKKT